MRWHQRVRCSMGSRKIGPGARQHRLPRSPEQTVRPARALTSHRRPSRSSSLSRHRTLGRLSRHRGRRGRSRRRLRDHRRRCRNVPHALSRRSLRRVQRDLCSRNLGQRHLGQWHLGPIIRCVLLRQKHSRQLLRRQLLRRPAIRLPTCRKRMRRRRSGRPPEWGRRSTRSVVAGPTFWPGSSSCASSHTRL